MDDTDFTDVGRVNKTNLECMGNRGCGDAFSANRFFWGCSLLGVAQVALSVVQKGIDGTQGSRDITFQECLRLLL